MTTTKDKLEFVHSAGIWCKPEFDGPVLKIRMPNGGEEVEVPS